ncbi:RimJ/RimL family protein N-acetyltransferase [Nocardiopsis arvandica]|jgi:RimJ/RimL family protein N-acetyltransferase|uniref:RimJ/RimL family protein N-acetyltransferase n=1 Tax=Nocardiopsis sinuspersici TaxID=501010 RepID=A0A7Z0BKJ2_9ACTN|nr:GNAT family protein [Nocardiopsis sinuspersici]NYH52517.1 RimJ/RimL family protein N-acetyltransferase [Nocardiopsis sinuspersici]
MSWSEQSRVQLETEHVMLTPLVETDREGWREQAMDPDIWTHFVTRVEDEASFVRFFYSYLAASDGGKRTTFTITDKASGRVAGSTSYSNMAEEDLRLEIGSSWLGREFRGRGINHWSKYLLMRHAFEEMGVERVEFKTDVLNERARRGLRAIGATEEGVLRSYNPMPDGHRRDAVYYSVLKAEWPDVREILEEGPSFR